MSEQNSYHHGDLKNALIEAGVEILSTEGVGGLSLRKVAKKAGVSHAAPYAHFADKQALIAAISTEGFRQLHALIAAVVDQYQDAPLRQFVQAAWGYVLFAQDNPDQFKIMFSSALEKEKDYPDFVTASQDNFQLVVKIVEACQAAGILRPGPADLMAVSVWSTIHGLNMLLLEGQISHTVLERFSLKALLACTLEQFSLVSLEAF